MRAEERDTSFILYIISFHTRAKLHRDIYTHKQLKKEKLSESFVHDGPFWCFPPLLWVFLLLVN
jgi:hypothetical protein